MIDNDDNWMPVTKNRSQKLNQQKFKQNGNISNDVSQSNKTLNSHPEMANNAVVVANGDLAKPSVATYPQQNHGGERRINHGTPHRVGPKVTVNAHDKFNGAAFFAPPTRQRNGLSGGDPRKAIDREIRDLARYEANIKNSRWHFEEELKKSEDRLKRAFHEMRERLNQRECDLLVELELCKNQGQSLLTAREEMEKQLKAQTARVASLNSQDLENMRQKIKKFLHEKRVEDEMGSTLRFQYEPDKLIQCISTFGIVQPINGRPATGARKSPSVASLVSADGGDMSSVDSLNVNNKPVINEVNVGGLVIQSDSMDPSQLADLTRQLQESLRLQGITEDNLPEVTGSLTCPMPQRRRPPGVPNGRGGGGENPQRGRGGSGSDKKKRGH